MKDSEKLGRVSGANLRQVNVSVPKDHLPKVSTQSMSSRTDPVRSKNHLGWYVALNKRPLEKKISHIPQIKTKWTCPPKFSVNKSWCVAAGEESHETEAQKHRETTLPEVVYPHISAIPPSPLTSTSIEREHCDDSQTPLIPTIPIEETELNSQTPVDSSANLTSSQCNDQSAQNKSLVEMLRGLQEGDLEVAAAAVATVAAVMENKEQIDTQLLIKLLTDPEMIKKLIDENRVRPNPQIPNTSLPLPSSVPANRNTQALNQFLTMPFSKPETSINSAQGLNLKPIYTTAPASVRFMPDVPSVKFSQLLNQTYPLISRPQVLNQSLTLPCSKAETPVNISESQKLKQIYASKPASIGFMPDGSEPVQPVHSHTRPFAVIKQVRPLMLRPDDDDEMITRICNKYRGPNPTGVAPINPSTRKPNVEAIKKLINEYGSSDARPNMGPMNEYGAWGKSFLEQNPLLPASNPLKTDMVVPPSANLHALPNALNSNFISTSNFHFPSSEVNICAPRPVDYYKSLIKQHGEKHVNRENNLPFGQHGNYLQGLNMAQNKSIEIKPKYQKPCLYFNTARGCRNGSNCSYLHEMAKQQRAGVLMETHPVAKRMKF